MDKTLVERLEERTVDYDGSRMHDLEEARGVVTCGLLHEAAAALRATGGGEWVPALDVFRIAGGDVECSPRPSAEQALDCLRDLRDCYDEALREANLAAGMTAAPTPAATGEEKCEQLAQDTFAGRSSSTNFPRASPRVTGGGEWVMVPRVPTEAMREAGAAEINRPATGTNRASWAWATMLAAAPTPAEPLRNARPNTPQLLYALADESGTLELRGPYVLATEWEGQALRLSHSRGEKDISCYAYVGKWPVSENGPTSKQAWWAGARAGLGLPADTPRAEVAGRLAQARGPLRDAGAVAWLKGGGLTLATDPAHTQTMLDAGLTPLYAHPAPQQPGVSSKEAIACHAVVTDQCRNNRSNLGAANEAITRMFDTATGLMEGPWPIGKGAKLHFRLSVEYPAALAAAQEVDR